jgi:asparagine synthase (glutamine-hydrolysing)
LLNRSGVSGIFGRVGFDDNPTAVLTGADIRTDAPVGVNERHTIRVIADADLTNAAEIRHQLESRAHRFRTTSDAELIAHAYEEWGPHAVARLRGAFACAVWDADLRRLVLARDHIGLRRLCYALLPGNGVVFSSNLRALTGDPRVGRDWSAEAIDAYLALGYVPAPMTPYRRISKLEPAQLLRLEGRAFRLERYWDLPLATPVGTTLDARLATLDAGLRAVVETNRAPATVLYSGGAASTVLLSATPPEAAQPVTVDLEQDSSELTRSETAATWLGHARQLEYAAPDVMSLATALASELHEPFAATSALVQLAAMCAARRHAQSAIAAHGASLLWAGRPIHHVDRQCGRLTDPRAARAACEVWDGPHRRSLYTREFSWQVRGADPASRILNLHAAHPSDDPLERELYVDLRTSFADRSLACAGAGAAVAGLSLRLPFLERDLVVLAATTPTDLKRRGASGVHSLRRLLLRRLPRRLMPPMRPQPPRYDWLLTTLASAVPAMLLTPRFDGRGIISRVTLRHVWNEHRAGRRNHAWRLWSLVMLECWFRQCVDGAEANEPLEYAVLKAVA